MGARQKKGLAIAPALLKEPQAVETTPSLRAVVGAVAGLAAAWLAAGSLGIMAPPLRHALTWLALITVVLSDGPPRGRSWKSWLVLALGTGVAAVMTMSTLVVYNVLAVALVLALVAEMRTGLDRRAFLIVATAAGLLGIYRLAVTSIPAAWSLADALGYGLGRLVGALSGQSLSVGATFGGLDFLIVMGVLYAGWLLATPRPWLTRALCGLAAIVVGQMLYLTFLAYAAELRAALPPPPPPPESDLYIPAPWSWSLAVASLLPWNLPLVGAAIHLIVAAMLLRWASWLPVSPAEERPFAWRWRRKKPSALAAAPWILAVLVPLIAVLSFGRSDLTGKRVVVYNKGYLNWVKPEFNQYGQPSAGAYGMLPSLIESLGGQLIRSEELTEAELSKADVLLLIHPMTPWPEAIQKRVWEYVRRGGSLLVAAEPRVLDEGKTSAFDELLEPTAMRVRFDTAIAANYKWEHSCAALAHPATTGATGEPNRFGVIRGASLDISWPARPMLLGTWAWSDPGSDAVLTQSFRYETGEKLGDLVLAAEQPIGQGTVAVLTDAYGLKNEGLSRAYEFTGRLLGYLAWRPGNPQATWRQLLGLAACLILVGLVVRRPQPTPLALLVVVLGVTLAMVTEISGSQSRVLPDGTKGTPYNTLAYIDASHLNAFSNVDWTLDDTVGLKLTLMRNGYLPLMLSEFSPEALDRAGLLISIAPGRTYSPAERQIVRQFVERGGTFICTVGAEQAGPVQPLLNDFGFSVPLSPLPPGDPSEPTPMGCIRGAYVTAANDARADVLLYAGWPIVYPPQNITLLVHGVEKKPVMACARVGQGRVLVVGDSGFALNKNLEDFAGNPLEGGYDNADFWRWLITHVNNQPQWTPPTVQRMKPATLDNAKSAAGGLEPLRSPGKKD